MWIACTVVQVRGSDTAFEGRYRQSENDINIFEPIAGDKRRSLMKARLGKTKFWLLNSGVSPLLNFVKF